LVEIALGKPLLNSNVALCPSKSRELSPKHCHARLCFWIVLRECVQESDPPHPVGLLCERRQLPSRRAAKARNEFAPSHPSTSAPVSLSPSDT
jgi:hypothetical protein